MAAADAGYMSESVSQQNTEPSPVGHAAIAGVQPSGLGLGLPASISYCGMSVPAITAGVLVVHGGGLISSARDYALFLIVLAVAALAGLLLTTRSKRPRQGDDGSPDGGRN
jgi:hypothetical protein